MVPGYIEALHVTARTDLVAFVPRRLIGALAKQLSLATVTPPLDPGIDEQFMFYPTRAQMDPGSIWLRNIMLGIGREMEREQGKSGSASSGEGDEHTAVIPREGGVSSNAVDFSVQSLTPAGILGRPVKPGRRTREHDVRDSRDLYFARAFPNSLPLLQDRGRRECRVRAAPAVSCAK